MRRVLGERRRAVTLLAIGLVANVGVYAALVYPLHTRVAAADTHAAQADQARRAAQRDFDSVRAVSAGKEQAEAELRAFYERILPADLSAANRATYVSVAQLARDCNLRYVRRGAGAVEARAKGQLDQWKIGVVLEGDYANMRQFVHRLENAPYFVVIDEMSIEQGRTAGDSLVLSLTLSTYYRTSHGG
jgi:Tfp pilus assembly protein PilO